MVELVPRARWPWREGLCASLKEWSAVAQGGWSAFAPARERDGWGTLPSWGMKYLCCCCFGHFAPGREGERERV